MFVKSSFKLREILKDAEKPLKSKYLTRTYKKKKKMPFKLI